MEVLVEHDYTAKKPDELSIRKGEIIKDVVKKTTGWFEGVLHDKRGVFPEHCVTMEKTVILRNKKETGRQCRAIFSYTQDHEDELNLKIGDVIDILGEEEEGWWRGVLNGKEGVFPSNFVQEITPTKIKPKSGSREDLNIIESDGRIPTLPPKPAKTLCEVKYAYKAQNEDELTLKEGDIITLLTKDFTDPGWWKGELNGKVGVFPDNFVQIIPGVDDKRDDQRKTMEQPKHSVNITQRLSLNDEIKNPPVPAKKPILPIKKSPSSGGGGGILSGLKKKLEHIERKPDSVDGAINSKSGKYEIKKNDENQNAFDQVERNSLLKDVRADRVKPPIRRPPTYKEKDDEQKQNDTGDEDEPNGTEVIEIKPQIREWEKHKAPWLEEMKMNQAKRSSTSPGPENKKVAHAEEKPEEKGVEMSKSMPSLGVKKLKSPEVDGVRLRNLLKGDAEEVKKVDMRAGGDHSPTDAKLVSFKQFNDLVLRVQELEDLLEKQRQLYAEQEKSQRAAINELRNELLAEVEKRRLLEVELGKMTLLNL